MRDLLLAAILSSTVVGIVLNAILLKRSTHLSETIKDEFARQMELFRADLEWKEASVSQLLGPVYMQLDRTARAFGRWKEKNVHLETEVIREGNVVIRDLLLSKGHLIPRELLDDAGKLIEHYDRWLEEFEKLRGGQDPELARFTFVGPQGFPFPVQAESNFRNMFLNMRDDLYAAPQTAEDGKAVSRP